jgi:hypothetical protein
MRTLAAIALAALGVPGPSRAGEDCRSCHADAHPGFERSGHALAATEPWYTRSLALTPAPLAALCARCHAPDRTAPAAGVTCASCHLAADGAVLVAHDRALEVAPHETRFEPALAHGARCAACHVVELPLGKDGAWVRLQDTPAEHARWRAATGDARGCVDCHAGGARAHFAGVRDPAFLASAVEIEAEARCGAAGEVQGEVRIANRTGHAFPGGSRLREAWVRAALVARDGRRVEVLAERLSIRGDPAAEEEIRDRRLAPAETRALAFRVAPPPGFLRAGAALEVTVDLALVSLDYPDTHPMIPPGEPRVVPVAWARSLVLPTKEEP